jgi:hypothetical protein
MDEFVVGDGLVCGKRFEVAAVVDLLHDGKTGKLDQINFAEREFEEDSAGGSAVDNADVLPCCIAHNSGKTRPVEKQVGIP